MVPPSAWSLGNCRHLIRNHRPRRLLKPTRKRQTTTLLNEIECFSTFEA